MRELAATVVAIFFVTVLGLAAFALDDRQTVVPAPEAVAESLVRQLTSDRAEQTRQFLSEYGRETYSPERLEAWMAGVEARTGPINRITASDVLMGDQLAQTTITMHGKARDVDARISLVRESGLWRVDALPEIE